MCDQYMVVKITGLASLSHHVIISLVSSLYANEFANATVTFTRTLELLKEK